MRLGNHLLVVIVIPLARVVTSDEHTCSTPGPRCSQIWTEPPRINGSRLWASITSMALLGSFEGPEGSLGVNREALSDIDAEGRKLLDFWATELKLQREVDAVGNTYYRRPGQRPGTGVVSFGSHLDSQPAGGRFDGSYGVLAGLEVMRTLHDKNIETDLDVELVNWCNEEGSRFSPPMMGSGVATGRLDFATTMATPAREDSAVTFGDELRRHGLNGDMPADIVTRNWVAYFEAHIEQGPQLESLGIPVGIVEGGQGQRTFSVVVEGFEGHSGTVPMKGRQDALVCASGMVLEVRSAGVTYGILATVGSFSVSPGSFNTIPGRVGFSIDLRSQNGTALLAADTHLREQFAVIAGDGYCTIREFSLLKARESVTFDPGLRGHITAASRSLGVQAFSIWSGAGHDACYVAELIPAAMIFVPCAKGISHNPRENATLDDVAKGADVLLGAVLRVAGGVQF